MKQQSYDSTEIYFLIQMDSQGNLRWWGLPILVLLTFPSSVKVVQIKLYSSSEVF